LSGKGGRVWSVGGRDREFEKRPLRHALATRSSIAAREDRGGRKQLFFYRRRFQLAQEKGRPDSPGEEGVRTE